MLTWSPAVHVRVDSYIVQVSDHPLVQDWLTEDEPLSADWSCGTVQCLLRRPNIREALKRRSVSRLSVSVCCASLLCNLMHKVAEQNLLCLFILCQRFSKRSFSCTLEMTQTLYCLHSQQQTRRDAVHTLHLLHNCWLSLICFPQMSDVHSKLEQMLCN